MQPTSIPPQPIQQAEIWKPVVGYEGFYSVSDMGRVKRVRGGQGARPKLLKPLPDVKGYMTVSLHKNGFRHTKKVHRLVLIAFRGLNPDKPQVNHKKGIKTDNRLSELEWMSNRENCIHAIQVLKCMRAYGERSSTAKITTETALQIKMMRLCGFERSQIAERFNVGQKIVDDIIYGRSWKHLKISWQDLSEPQTPPVVIA